MTTRQTPPPPILGSEPNTWAHSTVVERLPRMALEVIQKNKFSSEIEKSLKRLHDEIPRERIRPLNDISSPDFRNWETYIKPHLGKNWLEVPWFFAEHYFYRRIVEAVHFFEIHQDPFIRQKHRGLETSLEALESLAATVNARLEKGDLTRSDLIEALTINLWGNQADLSLWPADGGQNPSHANLNEAQSYILADDREDAARYLNALKKKSARIDFLIDNAGFELGGDLALADLFLTGGFAEVVKMHVKAHPTFVSDALATDVWSTVYALKNNDRTQTQALGKRLHEHLMTKRLELIPGFFWNSPRAFWDMPQLLRQDLEKADLVISKGDANYRRLLGDRHWPLAAPFADILSHFPVPLLAMRTLKAEIGAGLSPSEVERAQNADPHWMTDGRWAVAQMGVTSNR